MISIKDLYDSVVTKRNERRTKKNMARNLVKEEQADKEQEAIKQEASKVGEPAQAPAVQIITTEALLINNIDVVNNKVDQLIELVKEGFKQVGVVY